MNKRTFDGIVMISFFTMIASHSLLRAWSRKHLAEGHGSGTGNSAAGAIALTV